MSSVTCPSCGTVVEDGLWFCPVCSAQVAGPRAVTDTPPPQLPPPPGPPAGPPPRRGDHRPTVPSWIWPLSALVLFLVVGIVAGALALSHHDTPSVVVPPDSPKPGQASGSPARDHHHHRRHHRHRSASPSPSGSPSSADPATVAAQVEQLIAQETEAHAAFTTAVENVAACRDLDVNRSAVGSFAATRARLLGRLRSLPASGSPQLNALTERLATIWAGLVGVDQRFIGWSASAHLEGAHCVVGIEPESSTAAKDARAAFRTAWLALLAAHPDWGVEPDQLLEGSSQLL